MVVLHQRDCTRCGLKIFLVFPQLFSMCWPRRAGSMNLAPSSSTRSGFVPFVFLIVHGERSSLCNSSHSTGLTCISPLNSSPKKEVSSRIYELRILKRNAVVKSQGTKQREQRSLGHGWQWKANGQCSKGDNCSFRHDMCEQHTSHVTVSRWCTFNDTHMRGSSSSLVCAVHISHHLMCHHHAFMLCVWFSMTSLLSSSCCLSSIFSFRPVFLSGHQLLLPRCGVPCALPLMRTLAPLPSTTLSQVMSPTTITSRKPLNRTSRNPPATTALNSHDLEYDDYTLAWRSLHHCSPRSDKMQRAVDEFITLMTKVCRPVSPRLSVIERGDRCGTVWLTDLKRQRKSAQ